MTRKAVPYKGEKYYYYYCPTTKKRGCYNATSLKEADLIECVLIHVKAYIKNVASLEQLLTNLDATRLASELTNNLMATSINQRKIGL
jgi:hypothetical protein